MGKKSNRGNNHRVVFICLDCAYLAGKTDANLNKTLARWYQSSCSICHRDKPVMGAEAWGFFTAEQAAQARTKLKELQLDRKSFANPKDVKNLVSVVETVLADGMSEATREMLNIVVSKLANGEPIEVYLTKQLTYAFTQDVVAQREVAKVKAAAAKPKRKKRGLVVVEGGVERGVELKDGESKNV